MRVEGRGSRGWRGSRQIGIGLTHISLPIWSLFLRLAFVVRLFPKCRLGRGRGESEESLGGEGEEMAWIARGDGM